MSGYLKFTLNFGGPKIIQKCTSWKFEMRPVNIANIFLIQGGRIKNKTILIDLWK